MRKMPESTGRYLNLNDGQPFAPKKRQFSRRNQHYISHFGKYNLESMINEIQQKQEKPFTKNDIKPYADQIKISRNKATPLYNTRNFSSLIVPLTHTKSESALGRPDLFYSSPFE